MRRALGLLVSICTAAATVGAVVLDAAPAGATVPAGFADQFVASVTSPTAMAFTPDGRLLVATQPGALRVIQGGAVVATPAIDLSAKLCSNSERGLLGVAVDPAFATNGYVFLYYTFKKTSACDSTAVNRVSRFVMTGNTLGSETVLLDNIPNQAGNHNGGDLHFGNDNLLYASVGDGGCDYLSPGNCGGANDASRDQNAPIGKILRIDRDGNVPASNPFTGAGTARCNNGVVATGLKCQETFAWGLRNPFRIAFDPNTATPRFNINDVGQSSWEEIDAGAAGADYGWNVREGHCATGSTTNCGAPPAGMTNPIFDYGRADGCVTITGGAFVPAGVWPSVFDGKYLFADYGCGKIFRLDPDGSGGFTRVEFASGLGGGSAVDITFGPWRGSQALYYTTYANGGQVRRIARTDGATDDYNGDGKTDVAVFRPSNGVWYVRNGATTAWGTNGDVAVPGDYDGDGQTDLAVYRPSNGVWYVRQSTGSDLFVGYGGVTGDIPVPADYDGDGKTDIAIFRPSSGTWFVRGGVTTAWGTSGDVPVPADYNGDGASEIAVFRPSTGVWFVQGGATTAWGTSGDVPVPGDYDGNATADVAVFRPSNGVWFVLGGASTPWGTSGDVALPLPAAARPPS